MAAVLSMALAVQAGNFRNILSTDAHKLLRTNRSVFLLDVRTPDEFRQARLKGAVLIPVTELERRVSEIPRNRPVIVYCAVGSRSNVVAGYLVDRGYKDVYNMVDGIVGWYQNGLPIMR
jgi:rhodanese-related sulfurtransferase